MAALAPLLLVLVLVIVAGFAQDTNPALYPPAGNSILLRVEAHGRQIYTCQESAMNLTYVFSRARATLLSDADEEASTGSTNVVGMHFFRRHPDAGQGRATWATNASSVTGAIIFTSLNVAPNVPSLLLKATSHRGTGLLSRVSYIQRLMILGGAAPTQLCDHAGSVLRVPYQAYYIFWTQDRTIPPNTPSQILVPQPYKPIYSLYAQGAQLLSNISSTSLANATLSLIPGARSEGSLSDFNNGELTCWELLHPQSRVIGKPIKTATVDNHSLNWTLYSAISHEGNNGGFASVKFIQRLSTLGGLPLATNQSSNFSAIYWFYSE